jgi:hypothetical protein
VSRRAHLAFIGVVIVASEKGEGHGRESGEHEFHDVTPWSTGEWNRRAAKVETSGRRTMKVSRSAAFNNLFT